MAVSVSTFGGYLSADTPTPRRDSIGPQCTQEDSESSLGSCLGHRPTATLMLPQTRMLELPGKDRGRWALTWQEWS